MSSQEKENAKIKKITEILKSLEEELRAPTLDKIKRGLYLRDVMILTNKEFEKMKIEEKISFATNLHSRCVDTNHIPIEKWSGRAFSVLTTKSVEDMSINLLVDDLIICSLEESLKSNINYIQETAKFFFNLKRSLGNVQLFVEN